MPLTIESARRAIARLAVCSALAAGLALAGCADPSSAPVTGSLAAAGSGMDLAALEAAHKANPGDAAAALAYARALRGGGAKAEALAVLDKASTAKSTNNTLRLERGLLALELGHAAKAERLLRQAHHPKAPDWRVHSALGAALASRGRQQEAQAQFAKALALAPDHPTVLNNLALSYALDGKVAEAEKLLRKAKPQPAQAPQVKQNLALVLGLRGKYDEARTLGEAALPPPKAAGNVDYLKRLASAKSSAARADNSAPAAAGPDRRANASLPQPSYQLGAAPRD